MLPACASKSIPVAYVRSAGAEYSPDSGHPEVRENACLADFCATRTPSPLSRHLRNLAFAAFCVPPYTNGRHLKGDPAGGVSAMSMRPDLSKQEIVVERIYRNLAPAKLYEMGLR